MLAYLRSYAANFQLFPHIRFRHEVLNVRRADKFEHTGKWTVTYRKLSEKVEDNCGPNWTTETEKNVNEGIGEILEETFGQFEFYNC
jgi:hypothetical protein